MDRLRFLQYIGARYVPKFYVNSQNPDSSEWEPNVDYEYMTWVSLPNGSMYLSKTNVPATVGSPVSNPEYWMTAGQFNAYIQQLQSEINDMNDVSINGSLQNQIASMQNGSVPGSLQNQINGLHDDLILSDNTVWSIQAIAKKNVILVADSWGTTQTGALNNWISVITPYFNSVYPVSLNGRTFDTYGAMVAGVVVPAGVEIDAIIAIGGANGYTTGDMANFVSTCRGLYPNAEIVVGANGPCLAFSPAWKIAKMIEHEGAGEGCKIIEGLWDTIYKMSINNVLPDYYHLIDYTEFVENIISYLASGIYKHPFNRHATGYAYFISAGNVYSYLLSDVIFLAYNRNEDGHFVFRITFEHGTNWNQAAANITLTAGSIYQMGRINISNMLPHYDQGASDAVATAGYLLWQNEYIQVWIYSDRYNPFCDIFIRAKQSGTFPKETLIPDFRNTGMLRGKFFDFVPLDNDVVDVADMLFNGDLIY